ncbi:MAG TPA: type II 3-dehydroquinate dehydratase [Gemmatimonadaceae bacterium]|nr:type II 3-dehydroquinate dehydratase [Gemmatimonadaceae bacterium]
MARGPEEVVRIAVLNGPNLNLLGVREPELYGRQSLDEIEQHLRDVARDLHVELEFAQRNGEGELVDVIQSLRGRVDGALINAGAYSHSSLAIRDAFAAVQVPFVEVHLSNIFAREPERRQSMLAPSALALVCGFGARGYELALRGIVASLERE